MTKVLEEIKKTEEEKKADKRRQICGNIDQLWRLVRTLDDEQVSLDYLEQVNDEVVNRGNQLIPFQKKRIV